MALTVSKQIKGQEGSINISYCYLYEPLFVTISESDTTATKIYIDLEILDASNKTLILDTKIKYADFDIASGLNASVDLMKIAKQFHDANVYKFGKIENFIHDNNGKESVVSKYIFNFKIYSDKTAIPVEIKKLPILGGRNYSQFTPIVSNTSPITEFEYYGLDIAALEARWKNTFLIHTVLNDLSTADIMPALSTVMNDSNYPTNVPIQGPCGGFLIWKSRFGGWMFWGFDLMKKTYSKSYRGTLDVGIFESTNDIDGNTYVPVDYISINNSYSVNLKAIGLNQSELKAVSGISASPAVYLIEEYNVSDNGNMIPTLNDQRWQTDSADIVAFKSNYNWSATGGPGGFSIAVVGGVATITSPGGGMGMYFPGKYLPGKYTLKIRITNTSDYYSLWYYDGSIFKEIAGLPGATGDYTNQVTIPNDATGLLAILPKSGGLTYPVSISIGYYSQPDQIGNSITYNGPKTKIELMRLTSASAPISSLANGGDFSVSLKSISKTSQKTM